MTESLPRVLVVDDEDGILMALKMLLTDAGFAVETAGGAEAALKLVGEVDFGVAVIDKNLEGPLSGLDLVAFFHEHHPLVRVIVYTGYPSTESAIEAFDRGAYDYIPKPVDNNLMVAKVRRAWKTYELDRERTELLRDYETLFEVVPGVTWFVTNSGVFQRISEQGAKLLGYEPHEIIGKKYEHFMPAGLDADEDPFVYWAFNERRVGYRATRCQLVTMVTKSGDHRILELSSAASYGDPTPDAKSEYRGTLVVGVDVTDRVGLLNELNERSKMNALGRMAGGVAHDINNVLAVVMASVSFIRDDITPNADMSACLRDMEEATVHAAGLTSQLLVFGRQQPVEAKVVDVKQLLNASRGMLKRLVPHNIEFEYDVAGDVGAVLVDETQLGQVVMNLAVNAADAMPEGGLLTVSAKNTNVDASAAGQGAQIPPGDYVQISVSDTGGGMTEDVKRQVFEPFFSTKPRGQGTGLGLALVYGVVKQSGGYVVVYTELAFGTTFKVFLPIAAERPQHSTMELTTPRLGHERILLVDDDDRVRRVLRRGLQRWGYQVDEAFDGEEALATWASRGPFDLVITDVVMPKMGGAELAQRLRELCPTVPIMYCSGYVGRMDRQHAFLTNFTSFLQKPFTEFSLATQVRALLDGHPD